jgi:5-methylcytosine-specific restriction protein A
MTYGKIGDGYIHVHHLTPLNALKGKPQKIDPIKDLRPVCPNCHEMLHKTDPPYTIERLKEIIVRANDLGLGSKISRHEA